MKKWPITHTIYLVLECLLFAALLTFQIISIVEGHRIYNQDGPYSVPIGVFQLSLTAATFIYSVILFFKTKGSPRTLYDLFPVYFLLILTADVFFSFGSLSLGGHIGFLCAYILFYFMRKGHWVEGIIALVGGGIALAVFAIVGMLTPILGVDCFLGAFLVLNLVMTWVKYAKSKDKTLILIGIALALILLSDGSIALRTFITSLPGNHIFALITWPTYVAGNILLAFSYFNIRERVPEAKKEKE